MISIGQVLQNRYRIDARLGHGGMGAVFRAYDVSLDVACVVKEMLPPEDPSLAEKFVEQFHREAKTLAKLQHPNLPRVTNYFVEEGGYYLVMDLVDGVDLQQLIGTHGLPEATVLDYADQLLDVLTYIHEQGVVHRDIKPANVIVKPDGQIMLVDFGLAKVLNFDGNNLTLTSLHGVGTPQYAPPEQYTGGTDQRSDIYALGATLYQALTGCIPPSATDQMAGVTALQPPHKLTANVSSNTEHVILKAMDLRLDGRWQSAAEMRKALTGATHSRPPSTHLPTPLQSETVVLPEPIQPAAPTPAPAPVPAAPPTSAPASAPRTVPYSPARQARSVPPWVFAGVVVLVLLAIAFVVIQLIIKPAPVMVAASTPTQSMTLVASAQTATLEASAHSGTASPQTPMPSAGTPTGATATSEIAGVLIEATPTASEAAADTPTSISTSTPPATATDTSTPTSMPAATSTPIPHAPSYEPTSTPVIMTLNLARGVSLQLVDVPAGPFLMGSANSDPNAYGDEKPQQKLFLDDFWIGKYEVTNLQYSIFAKATGLSWNYPSGKDNYPAQGVSWANAVAFCAWASKVTSRNVRLPTEAEWEKAARGTDGRLYPWGNEPPNSKLLNYYMNVGSTTPVGQYSPAGDSPYGASDMAGNIWEWTSSLYKPYPYKADDGREDPTLSGERVLRGGGVYFGAPYVRSAYRHHFGLVPFDLRLDEDGLRVAVSP